MNKNAEFLKTIEIFAPLSEVELDTLSAHFQSHEFKANDSIIKQGERSDQFFAICEGVVNVTKGEENEREVFITALGEGECFGEASLFHDVKRTANIRSFSETKLLAIRKSAFLLYLGSNPGPAQKILYQILKRLFQRLEQTSAELHFERKDALAQNAIDQLFA